MDLLKKHFGAIWLSMFALSIAMTIAGAIVVYTVGKRVLDHFLPETSTAVVESPEVSGQQP